MSLAVKVGSLLPTEQATCAGRYCLCIHSEIRVPGFSFIYFLACVCSSSGDNSLVFSLHSVKSSFSSVPVTSSSFSFAALPSKRISAPGFTKIGSCLKFGKTTTMVPSPIMLRSYVKRPPFTLMVSIPGIAPSGE